MIDKQLFKLIGKDKKYILFITILQLIGLLSNVGITASICWLIYIAINKGNMLTYLYPLICAIACISIRYITTRATGKLKDIVGRKVKTNLRESIYNKMLILGMKETENIGVAGITQISLEGVEQLDMYFASYLPQFFFSIFAPIILFIICFWIDWRTSLVLLACVPLIPLSIIAVSKYAKKIFAKYWDRYTSMGDKFLDNVQGLKELKILKADESQHNKMNVQAEEFRKITMKVLVMQLASTTIMDLVAYGGASIGIALSICGCAYWGLQPIYALFLILIAVEFFLPLRAFGTAFHIAMNGISAGKKIINLLNLPNPKWGLQELSKKSIELQCVTFSYDNERDVLKDVSMVFPSKGFTSIVGESGCGKSTIVKLLIGAYQPKKGSVIVGGISLEELDNKNYYSNIAVVSYNTYIFNQSIRENFLLANECATDWQIYEALKEVNLDNFVKSNGGLDKMISEDANNLSGGQRQRLALAINLVANKDIYIFDEATSNIDVESEAIIMKNIKKLSANKNVIVISHRLANVVSADNIYFLQRGEVKECGTHDFLMKQKQLYEKLFTAQKNLEEGYKL